MKEFRGFKYILGFALLLLTLSLTACIGEGIAGKVVISEVSSTLYNDDKPWFEIYNGSNQSIDLADYSVRTLSQLRVEPYNYYDEAIFNIPHLDLAAGEYAVIAGMGTDTRVNGDRIVYLLNADNIIPRWGDGNGGNGFVELLKGENSIDFVRFGNNDSPPSSPGAWQGPNVAALPRARTKHGYSIARDIYNSDSDSAADWSARNFATAGGPNDVPAFARDIDEDGIPDTAEVAGGKFAGLDLYAMGARTNKKDIFLEIDYMDKASRPGLKPQKAALDKVVKSFANNGINLHIDMGNSFSGGFSINNYNLGNRQVKLPFEKSIALSQSSSGLNGRKSFYQYKDRYMDINRKQIFHYMLFANSQKLDGSAGSSGRGEINGNDVIVTIGAWDLSTSTETRRNVLVNYQAGTIMHELGHNLGLLHGGRVGENFKPNYLSIMNYLYQLRGLGTKTGQAVADRFYSAKGYKGIFGCDLVNGPCSSSFVLDYSHGQGRAIDENSFSENIGIGYGNVWVDYNNNGAFDNNLSLNINGNGFNDINAGGNKKVLRDYNDWADIDLLFIRTWSGNSGSTQSISENVVFDAVANDYQQWSEEEAPSREFFDWLEQIR